MGCPRTRCHGPSPVLWLLCTLQAYEAQAYKQQHGRQRSRGRTAWPQPKLGAVHCAHAGPAACAAPPSTLLAPCPWGGQHAAAHRCKGAWRLAPKGSLAPASCSPASGLRGAAACRDCCGWFCTDGLLWLLVHRWARGTPRGRSMQAVTTGWRAKRGSAGADGLLWCCLMLPHAVGCASRCCRGWHCAAVSLPAMPV